MILTAVHILGLSCNQAEDLNQIGVLIRRGAPWWWLGRGAVWQALGAHLYYFPTPLPPLRGTREPAQGGEKPELSRHRGGVWGGARLESAGGGAPCYIGKRANCPACQYPFSPFPPEHTQPPTTWPRYSLWFSEMDTVGFQVTSDLKLSTKRNVSGVRLSCQLFWVTKFFFGRNIIERDTRSKSIKHFFFFNTSENLVFWLKVDFRRSIRL